MPRFRFRFQCLLDHRLHEECEKKVAVAALERERAAIEQEIRNHQATIDSQKADLRKALGGQVTLRSAANRDPMAATSRTSIDSLQAVRLQANASLHAGFRAQQAAIRLAGVHERLKRARMELQEAMKHRRAIELMRDRSLAEWRSQMEKREARELDELAVMRAGRNQENLDDDS